MFRILTTSLDYMQNLTDLLSDLHELESPDYLQHLNLQLNMLSLGHLSPSVIRPTDLLIMNQLS